MAGRDKHHRSNGRLEKLGREVVRAAASNADEGEAAAASPFLYARLRSRINDERRRREEGESWLALLGVVFRAAPAMALILVLAFALFLAANFSAGASGNFSDDALLATNDAGFEQAVFADRGPVSSDDVLTTVLDDDEREDAR